MLALPIEKFVWCAEAEVDVLLFAPPELERPELDFVSFEGGILSFLSFLSGVVPGAVEGGEGDKASSVRCEGKFSRCVRASENEFADETRTFSPSK